MRYNISDNDDRFLNQQIIYETHSDLITVKVVKAHSSPTHHATYLYIGLSDGSLIEINGEDGRQLRQFKFFQDQFF